MEHHLQLNRILLLLMGTICGTQAARVENLFKKLDPCTVIKVPHPKREGGLVLLL